MRVEYFSGEWWDESKTADEVILPEAKTVVNTGLLDVEGRKIRRRAIREPVGFDLGWSRG